MFSAHNRFKYLDIVLNLTGALSLSLFWYGLAVGLDQWCCMGPQMIPILDRK